MKTLLATEFDRYEKGEETREILQPFIGSGVFATDGKSATGLCYLGD